MTTKTKDPRAEFNRRNDDELRDELTTATARLAEIKATAARETVEDVQERIDRQCDHYTLSPADANGILRALGGNGVTRHSETWRDTVHRLLQFVASTPAVRDALREVLTAGLPTRAETEPDANEVSTLEARKAALEQELALRELDAEVEARKAAITGGGTG